MLSTAGLPLTGLSVTGQWMAWTDTTGPTAQGNPGFRTLSGAILEIGQSGVYGNALASTELPAASPWVMLKYVASGAATQYLLVRTASQFVNVTGINNANIAAPVTAGYMPVDVKQTIALTSMADNSIEKSLARVYFATDYLNAAVTSRFASGGTLAAVGSGAITSGSFASGAIDASAIATDAIGAAEFAADAVTEISTAVAALGSGYADDLLGRTLTRGASGGRTVGQSLMSLRNKVTISAGTITVFSNDDSTTEWSGTVATQAVTAIVTSIDPA